MGLEMLRDAATIRDEREPEAFHAGTLHAVVPHPRPIPRAGGGVATQRTSVTVPEPGCQLQFFPYLRAQGLSQTCRPLRHGSVAKPEPPKAKPRNPIHGSYSLVGYQKPNFSTTHGRGARRLRSSSDHAPQNILHYRMAHLHRIGDYSIMVLVRKVCRGKTKPSGCVVHTDIQGRTRALLGRPASMEKGRSYSGPPKHQEHGFGCENPISMRARPD